MASFFLCFEERDSSNIFASFLLSSQWTFVSSDPSHQQRNLESMRNPWLYIYIYNRIHRTPHSFALIGWHFKSWPLQDRWPCAISSVSGYWRDVELCQLTLVSICLQCYTRRLFLRKWSFVHCSFLFGLILLQSRYFLKTPLIFLWKLCLRNKEGWEHYGSEQCNHRCIFANHFKVTVRLYK